MPLVIVVVSICAAAFAAQWKKHPSNPVMGLPELGMCFDQNVVTGESAKYNRILKEGLVVIGQDEK